MNTQLFVSNATPMSELLVPIENDSDVYSIQKPTGGLWTSTYREESKDSAWVEWCRGENYSNPDILRWFLLTPKTDCKIYTINSLQDFTRCLIEYGDITPLARMHSLFTDKRVINFEKLAKEFDGLHLTEKGNGETHLSYPNDLNAWDCESTLWFRWCFTSVETVRMPVKEISA